MSKIFFYHLIDSQLNQSLIYFSNIVFVRKIFTVIQFSTEQKMDIFDKYLWTHLDYSFISHGTKNDKYPEQQPIFLTTNLSNPNYSKTRFLVEGSKFYNIEQYNCVIIFFEDKNKYELKEARKLWIKLKNSKYKLIYWKQKKK